MALNLFRRHRRNCHGSHEEDSCSSEFEERRPRWKRCDCPIHASGTLAGRYRRRCTDQATWEDALKWASAVEAVGHWDTEEVPSTPTLVVVPTPVTAPEAAADSPPQRTTIPEAIEVYLANRQAMVGYPTFRKHRTFAKQLGAFGASRGYVFLDQFRPVDIDVFYVTSTLGPRSKVKRLEMLRRFFRFALNRELISKSPVSPDLKPPAGASRQANKMPFTDEQLEDIIKACDQLEDKRWGNRFGTGVWTGEDVKEFIWVMVFTGLRISDVVLFDIERLTGNEVYLRAKKNGGDVFTWIPDWLRDRLNARAKRCGRKLFLTGQSPRLDTHTEAWRRRIYEAFALADVGEERATPHRFRHTFARILLQKGVPIAEVADLLGDDEETVRIHYARWVPERQARLTNILKDAFSDKPRLVAIQGGRA
jgi:integrase